MTKCNPKLKSVKSWRLCRGKFRLLKKAKPRQRQIFFQFGHLKFRKRMPKSHPRQWKCLKFAFWDKNGHSTSCTQSPNSKLEFLFWNRKGFRRQCFHCKQTNFNLSQNNEIQARNKYNRVGSPRRRRRNWSSRGKSWEFFKIFPFLPQFPTIVKLEYWWRNFPQIQ